MPIPATDAAASVSAQQRTVRIAWSAFFLIGWSGVLVPSLVRQIEPRFGVDDAAVGVWYLLNAFTYAGASFSGGLLTERFGRRVMLPAGAAAFAVGLAACGVAPSWPVFLLAAVPMGAGAGAIDGGMNALVLDVTGGGRGRALNLLHVFVGIGALAAPVVAGQMVDRGLPWEVLLLGTAAACAAVGIALRRAWMPAGRRSRPAATRTPDPGAVAQPLSRVPLLLLGIGIATYVAGEVGVSNWVVRFLDDVPVSVATLGLSGFWGGLAVGRLLAAAVSDRFSHGIFAAAAAVTSGVATLLAVLAPTTEMAIVAFTVAGIASGPVFPMIMALGGARYPDRLAAVTGGLTGAAVVGATVYPPLIGLLSGSLGIAGGLAGAAMLSVISGFAILWATRAARPAPRVASSARVEESGAGG